LHELTKDKGLLTNNTHSGL